MVNGMTKDAPLTKRNERSLVWMNGARRGFASCAIPILTANNVWAISRKQSDTRITVAFVTRLESALRTEICRIFRFRDDPMGVLC